MKSSQLLADVQNQVFKQEPRDIIVHEVLPEILSVNNILEMISNKTKRDVKLLSACCDRQAHI